MDFGSTSQVSLKPRSALGVNGRVAAITKKDESMKRWSRPLTIMLLLLTTFTPAAAQSSLSSPTPPSFTLQSPLDQKGAAVIKDGLGRPCLDIEAAARAERVNPRMLDHVVSILNKCPRTIKIKLCYAGVLQCKEFSLEGYKREDTILGSMMGVSYFKYTVTQQ